MSKSKMWNETWMSVLDPNFDYNVTETLSRRDCILVRACLHNCGGMRVEALIRTIPEYRKFLEDFLYKKPQTKISINFYPVNVKKGSACELLTELCKLTTCLDDFALATKCENGVLYVRRPGDTLCRMLGSLGNEEVYLLNPPIDKHYNYHAIVPFSDGSVAEGDYSA